MSRLTVYADDAGSDAAIFDSVDGIEIGARLASEGIRFERWHTRVLPSDSPAQEEITAAYQSEIDAFIKQEGFQSFDVISVRAHMQNAAAMREKFLVEHTHTEDEVRFFVEGSGVFYVHVGALIYRVVCEKGDLMSVPAHTPHWYDMGEVPHFTAIRLFNNPDGWIGHPVKKAA